MNSSNQAQGVIYTTRPVRINDVRIGDTVEHDGKLRTVGKGDLKHGGFCGTTLWGDSYRCGTSLVLKAEMTRAIVGATK